MSNDLMYKRTEVGYKHRHIELAYCTHVFVPIFNELVVIPVSLLDLGSRETPSNLVLHRAKSE